jgi:hypothetical protein
MSHELLPPKRLSSRPPPSMFPPALRVADTVRPPAQSGSRIKSSSQRPAPLAPSWPCQAIPCDEMATHSVRRELGPLVVGAMLCGSHLAELRESGAMFAAVPLTGEVA